MSQNVEKPPETRMLGVRMPPDMWLAISAEAHKRSLAAGHTIGTGQIVREAVAAMLGTPAETAPRKRKAIVHRVTSAKTVRNRNRATGCTAPVKTAEG